MKKDLHQRNEKSLLRRKLMTTACIAILLFVFSNSWTQRRMEYLTRGLVAVKTTDYVFLSWRIFATDSDNVQFNLYKNGALVNATPIQGISNYSDSTGTEDDIYYLETIYDVDKKEISTPAAVWREQYKTIPLQLPGDLYYPNDASVGDLDGDGELEIIIKMQTSNPDNTGDGPTDPVFLQAYKINGTLLWSINLGVNIRAGAHYTQLMVYDLDSDGFADVACKTAPGTQDASGNYLSKGPAASDNDDADYRDGNGMVLTGPEYLTVFDGVTGNEVSTVEYIPVRGDQSTWGDTWGNRVDRFLACVAYFDSNPSLVMCRGYYTGNNGGATGTRGRTVMAAWDLINDSLVNRWVFNADYTGENSAYTGQGNHNLSVADVDNDGKDEIIYGAMAVDDNGTGLWTTGLGHGDAMHVSDIDPDRPGLEKWGITESTGTSGSQLLDAKTGEIIWGTPNGDIARGASADVSAEFYGMECWGGTDGLRSCTNEYVGNAPSSANFVIWWDDDLLREILNGVTVSKYYASGEIEMISAEGCLSNNGSKSTPNISGDILGDWREEMVFRTSDNKALRIYTTTIPTEYGIYTLLQDPQYRLALAWQNVSYNQPPHPGFYLGDGMNLDSIPVQDILVEQKEGNSSIRIISPTNGFELGLGLDLNIIVHAVGVSDTNQTIVIFNEDTPVDTIFSPPYYADISGLTSGDYSFVARAFNKQGGLMKSDTLNISVDKGFPHVTLTSPEEGNTYLPEDSILISADAFDTDGEIDSIVFIMNGTELEVITVAPYSIKIENPGIGIYELKAAAYDNLGNVAESEIVSLEVGLSITIQETDLGFCEFDNGEGWIESNNAGYTGTGFANTDNVSGIQVIWGVDFPQTGKYKFEWRYASSSDRPGVFKINDEDVSEIPFLSTGDWTTWETNSVTTTVQKGISKISVEALVGNGLGNVDYLKIYSLESSELAAGVSCDSIRPMDIATLADLSVTGVTLKPGFKETTTLYGIELEAGTTFIDIIATPTDKGATITGSGTVTIDPNSSTVDVIVTAKDGVTTKRYTIFYEFLTSVEDVAAGGIKLYPVPSSEFINVVLEDNNQRMERIAIYTMDGRKVLDTENINSNQIKIELLNLQKGIYLIQVDTDKGCVSRKLSVINE